MKSIYLPREEFTQSHQVWVDIQETMRRNGYTNYVIVLSKQDPDNDDKILFDTHYNVSNGGIIEAVKDLLERMEEETTT